MWKQLECTNVYETFQLIVNWFSGPQNKTCWRIGKNRVLLNSVKWQSNKIKSNKKKVLPL